eukprot:417431_1
MWRNGYKSKGEPKFSKTRRGENNFKKFTQRVVDISGLGFKTRNHEIRAYKITAMKKAGCGDRDVMRHTGQRQVTTLDTYDTIDEERQIELQLKQFGGAVSNDKHKDKAITYNQKVDNNKH